MKEKTYIHVGPGSSLKLFGINNERFKPQKKSFSFKSIATKKGKQKIEKNLRSAGNYLKSIAINTVNREIKRAKKQNKMKNQFGSGNPLDLEF